MPLGGGEPEVALVRRQAYSLAGGRLIAREPRIAGLAILTLVSAFNRQGHRAPIFEQCFDKWGKYRALLRCGADPRSANHSGENRIRKISPYVPKCDDSTSSRPNKIFVHFDEVPIPQWKVHSGAQPNVIR